MKSVKKSTQGVAKIRAIHGMASKIATHLKLYRGSVSRWKSVPAEHVVEVEKVTGIPREELRPDLYRR